MITLVFHAHLSYLLFFFQDAYPIIESIILLSINQCNIQPGFDYIQIVYHASLFAAMLSFHYVPRAESDGDVHRYTVITESAIPVVHSKKAESATMINVGRTYALL